MPKTRLDLAALRRLEPSALPAAAPSLSTASPSDVAPTAPAAAGGVSRRTAIQAAGLAAAGLFPALKQLHIVLGGLELVGDERRLAFVLGGRERWVIDLSRFAGAATLRHEKRGGKLRVELRGARYPGTTLPADFVCELTPDVLGCRMRLALALGRFHCEAPFEAWLEGTSRAQSRVRLRERCPLGARTSLELSGNAEADFSPAGVLTLSGTALAELRGGELGGRVTADGITLALLPADEPSVLTDPPSRRARFTLARGTRAWHLRPPAQLRPSRGTLRYADEPFDLITIETGEGDRREVRRALVASTGAGVPAGWYAPEGGLVDADGLAPTLPLHDARYAAALDRRGAERAFLAAFGEPTWLHGPGFSIEVGVAADAAPFELHAAGPRAACTTRCEPALLRTVVPVAGALVAPAPAPPGSRIDLTGESAEARLCFDPARACHGLFVAPAPPLSILRPKDLLALDFAFVNLALDLKGAGQAELVRQPGNNPSGSFVIVQFPPQNIAEQAFWERARDPDDQLIAFVPQNSAGGPLKKEDAGYEAPKGDETPDASKPVQARIAGRSRLGFRLPAGMDRIDYTLASLLDWARFEPSVAATALPPPPPPSGLMVQGVLVAGGQAQVAAKAPAAMDVSAKVKAAPHVDAGLQQNVVQRLQQAAPRRGGLPPQRVSTIAATVIQTRPGSEAFTQAAINDLAAKLQLPPYPPAAHETGIEAPYRLLVSPNRFGRWVHATGDVTHERPTDDLVKPAITELWHTRLGVKRALAPKPGEGPVDEDEDYYRTIRAVWSPDYDVNATDTKPVHYQPPSNAGNPFRMSLDARDRHELVTLTADHRLVDSVERIVRVDRLMLTALGAWMNVRGAWDLGEVTGQIEQLKDAGQKFAAVSVEEWRHRATFGRDHYVRVVYKGYLFPFGHKASLVKVTERKFHWIKDHQVAFLRQRMYVVVRQPEKRYPVDFQPFEGRKFPFQRVRLLTLVTPNLDEPSADDIVNAGQAGFWLNVKDEPFLFSVVADDVEGHPAQFTMPLAFIDNTRARDGAMAAGAATSLAGRPERTRPLNGQKVAFADPQKPGDTTFETESLTFGAHFIKNASGDATPGALSPAANNVALAERDLPRFYPTVEGAKVEIPAVKHLTGAAGVVAIKFPQRYIDRGFAGALGDATGNYGQLFAELDAPAGLGFGNGGVGTDKVGGFAAPSLNILGLSRLTGPVSGQAATGLGDMLKGSFDPTKFFEGLDVKLLGAVSLLDIVQLVTDGFATDLGNLRTKMEQEIAALPGKATAAALGALPKCRVPAFLTQLIYDAENTAAQVESALKRPKQMQLVFKWDPVVSSVGPFRVDGAANDTLSMTSLGLVELPLDGSPPKPPSYTVSAALKNFTLDLFGVIAIKVKSVKFTKQANEKPDVSADIDTIEFAGPLRFINELQSVIPSDGFSDPPSLEVSPTGLKIGYSLGLPTIAVGAFTLQNVTLGAALSLPFTGDALRFRFFFCTREQPFLLTVYGLGGGGFFALELGMDGVELLEASLEFGASVAIDLGVASGGVTIMGGIYFKLENDVTTLTGYVRLNGELDVLGLISASLTFYLALTYQSSPEMVWGEATLTIEVEVLFFSADVEVSVRKEFATPPAPPFAELMNDDEWATYRLAFAA